MKQTYCWFLPPYIDPIEIDTPRKVANYTHFDSESKEFAKDPLWHRDGAILDA